MLSRRNVQECDPIIDQLISQLQLGDQSSQQQIEKRVNSAYLQKYFVNIHHHINHSNLCHVQAYETLTDGLYILLRGEVRLFINDKCQKSRKCDKSRQVSTALINRSWWVFQSVCKNCTCSQQTFLLKITEQQAALTKFNQLFALRNQLYFNHYLSQDHQGLYRFGENKVITLNVRIHSNFQFKSYFFREIICLDSPAIVSRGRAKLKRREISSHEFARYGVLLPNLKYQVTSSQVEIMIIKDNETLFYHLQQIKPHLSTKHTKAATTSVHASSSGSPNHADHDEKSLQLSKRQKEKRNRELGKLFKVSQPYSVISTFLCKKNLSFAKNYNVVHQTKRLKENRYKNPLVLFNIANQKSKMVIPNFCDITNVSQDNNKTVCFQKMPNQSESKSVLLRKIRLQPAQYSRIVKKHRQHNSKMTKQRGGVKGSMDFTMERLQFSVSKGDLDLDPLQTEQFVPYPKY